MEYTSEMENYAQAVDRFVRLAKVMPDTQMTLFKPGQADHHQILVGRTPIRMMGRWLPPEGTVKIRANFKELMTWVDTIAAEKKGDPNSADDS